MPNKSLLPSQHADVCVCVCVCACVCARIVLLGDHARMCTAVHVGAHTPSHTLTHPHTHTHTHTCTPCMCVCVHTEHVCTCICKLNTCTWVFTERGVALSSSPQIHCDQTHQPQINYTLQPLSDDLATTSR